MNWMDILKVRTGKDNKTVIHRQGPQKVEVKTAGPNRGRKLRSAAYLGTIKDSPEAMAGSDQVNRNIAITERKKELAELRKDPQSRDIDNPKYQQAQRLQTMIGNMQAEQQNPVKIPQSGRPVMPEKTPLSPKGNVPLPSSTKPTERVPLPSSTKPTERVPLPSSTKPTERVALPSSTKPTERVALPKDQYQPPAKWERILNTRPPKPVMPTTSMPEKRPPMKRKERPPIKRKVIPSASPKQRAWEKSRLEAAANKVRNKSKEQLSEGVKEILNPPMQERKGPPPRKETNQQLVARRINEERQKSIETARANRVRRGPSGPPRGQYTR